MKINYTSWRIIKKISVYAALGTSTFIAVSPIVWMALSSIRDLDEVFKVPPKLIPTSIELGGYAKVLFLTPFLQCLVNSVCVTLITTGISIGIGSMGAYSIERWQKKGYANLISRGVLLAYLIPPILLVIPYFVILKQIGLVDTLLGLIITHTSFVLPFSTWLMIAYFSTLPKELEEAAKIDGCTNFGAFIRIALPLATPGIVAVAIFSFINSWNEFLYALLIITSSEKRTLTAGFYSFMGAEVLEWEPMIAWITLITIPPLVFFLFVQKYLIKGLTAGALKG